MDISKKSLCFLLRFLFGEWIAILLLVFAQDSVAFPQNSLYFSVGFSNRDE